MPAEARQREALQLLQSVGNPWEVAVARSALAELIAARGQRAEARGLLEPALPVMRRAVLPGQTDLKAAEMLAKRLGL